MKIPNQLVDAIYSGIKSRVDNTPRPHLGASLIGHSCDRWLWFSFRWLCREDFDGRILRLFERGQKEESWIIGDLRRSGLKISEIEPTTRKQYSFSDGHFGGSLDGIITGGMSPDKPHILEIKTHSLKSFNDLEKDGVEKSKPLHWAQMQIYMGKTSIDRALYVAICKDDERIYTERVRFNREAFEVLCDRAQRIIASDRMPEPLSADATWYECKFCAAHPVCHKGEIAKETHCRSCSNVTFNRNGEVYCEHWESSVPFDAQLNGCDAHVLHPDLVPWSMVVENGLVYWKIENQLVKNGEPDRDTFTSKEILDDPKACAYADDFIKDCRIELGGRVSNDFVL